MRHIETLDELIHRLTLLRHSGTCEHANDTTAEAMIFADTLGSIIDGHVKRIVTDLKGNPQPLDVRTATTTALHDCFVIAAIGEKWAK